MKKILIVEDDPITGRVYSTHLERAGYETRIATDGQSGLEEIAQFQPDGLLIDFMMPKLNGLDLVKTVRAMPGCDKIPLIIYSNAVVPAVQEAAFAAGATHLFDKSTLKPERVVLAFQQAGQPPDEASN